MRSQFSQSGIKISVRLYVCPKVLPNNKEGIFYLHWHAIRYLPVTMITHAPDSFGAAREHQARATPTKQLRARGEVCGVSQPQTLSI